MLTIGNVTISGINNLIDTNAYAAAANFPTYTSGTALGTADTNPALPNFTITFSSAVAQVGFGLFDPNYAGPAPNLISAFDAMGNLLETTSPDALFPPGGSGADHVGFVSHPADIARVEIVATYNPGGDAFWIDSLSYRATPVSAPSTLARVGLGLLAPGLRRRS